jgi:hypothetical protein
MESNISLLLMFSRPNCPKHTCSAVIPCSSVDFALNLPLSNNFCIPRNSPSLASCIKSCSIGSCGGLESKSLSSTCSRPSFPGELVALPELRRASGVVEGSREAMIDIIERSQRSKSQRSRCAMLVEGLRGECAC